jgi:hypothetical protein
MTLFSVIPCGIRNYRSSGKSGILQNFKEGQKGRNLLLKYYRPINPCQNSVSYVILIPAIILHKAAFLIKWGMIF